MGVSWCIIVLPTTCSSYPYVASVMMLITSLVLCPSYLQLICVMQVNNYIKKAAGGERLLLYNLLTWELGGYTFLHNGYELGLGAIIIVMMHG